MHLATIGSGSIVDTFLDAVSHTEGVFPEAVYSRTEERARKFAERHGIGKSYWDLGDMLADPIVDTVYIASPNSLHFSYAKQALEAGKHVICEKPFVSTKKEAEQLFALAEKKGLLLMEAITVLHMPVYKRVKEWLSLIGPVRLVYLNYSQYSSRYDAYLEGKVTNVFDPAYDGGALMDINVYNLHSAAGLFGRPQNAVYCPNRGSNGIDCSGTAVLSYDGFVCTCMGAKDCDGANTGLIEGEKGYILVENAGNSWGRASLHLRNGEEDHAEDLPGVNRMVYELRDFVKAFDGNDPEALREWRDESLEVMEILDRLRR